MPEPSEAERRDIERQAWVDHTLALTEALRQIEALKVTGPSPIGPLYGAGMAAGFEIAARLARQALSLGRGG